MPEPEPKKAIIKILYVYTVSSILKIASDNNLSLSKAERNYGKQLLIENISSRLNPNAVLWDSYAKLKGK